MHNSYHAHGQHVILDLYGIDAGKLNNPEIIEAIMLKGASILNATVLQNHLHHFGEDMGVTGVLLLAESHMSIHTWPEKGFAAIDIFMCGDINMSEAIALFIKEFHPENHSLHTFLRGVP